MQRSNTGLLLAVQVSFRNLVKEHRVLRGQRRNHPETKTCWRRVSHSLSQGDYIKAAMQFMLLVRRGRSGAEGIDYWMRMTNAYYLTPFMEWVQKNKVKLAELHLTGTKL